ncbi:hypothetical protein JOL79_11695 [Microbispora sp. RL4-1S]|uniref:Helix-turn-helix domain-containing protein n=1 Tax=Microbispora oryzae TaxID=2806554 RepID=A0A940WKC5_9ACTN|nr:hypothetical protein [Microbispora oryzae]MBP2704478.1 hypothetical protein [Microbispora oryzae]
MTAQPAWKALGQQLIARRVQLDPAYRNRRTFCEATGMEYRILSDAESGRRANYSKTTLRALEQAYQLSAGSIDRFIADGGPLETMSVAPGRDRPAAGERTTLEALAGGEGSSDPSIVEQVYEKVLEQMRAAQDSRVAAQLEERNARVDELQKEVDRKSREIDRLNAEIKRLNTGRDAHTTPDSGRESA